MIKKNYNKSEFDHFSNLANEWWDPNGKYGVLHDLTPLRMRYIKEILSKTNKIDNFNDKNLEHLDIIDIGCGGGLICEPLSRLGSKVTGIDFVKKNISIAKNHAKKSNLKINYFCKNINNIDISKKYDLLLLLEVIEHLDNWQEIIIKAKNLLKPKGVIIISSINRNILSRLFAIIVAENILKWIPKNTHKYEKLVKPDELTYVLKKNGFKVCDLRGMLYNPISKEWFLNRKNKKINYFCSAIKN